MSLLSYNGITLPYSQNTHCSQESVSDESNTDLMYTKFDITYRGVIHWAYINTIAPGVWGAIGPGAISSTTNPADIMDYIRKLLLVKRQTLSLTFNGIELIPRIMRTNVPDGGFPNVSNIKVDARNGPDPISCVISQLTNTSWMITYHIVAHYWENMYLAASGSSRNQWTGNPIISHRWSESVGIDQGGYSTFSRKGRFVMRSDNPDKQLLDFYRPNFALLSIRAGFIRKSAQYNVSPDGLTSEYEIVDFEVFKLPPQTGVGAANRGIYEAQGKFYISSPKRNSMRHLGVRLALRGMKSQSQQAIIGLAVGIATDKIQENIIRVAGHYRGVQESMRIEVDMYNNEVMVEATAICKAGAGRLVGNALFFLGSLGNHWTWTPGSDNIGVLGPGQTFQSPTHFLRGNADIFLQAAAYFDPSLEQTMRGFQTVPGTQVGKAI